MKNYRFLLFSLALLAAPLLMQAQPHLDWETLADVTFEERMSNEWAMQYQRATFGDKISAYEGREIKVTGYMIPMDALGLTYVLSKNPQATCFFCGGGGPETVVQLQMDPAFIQRYATDTRMTFRGVLELHEDNLEQFNYVLREAKPF
ncbi:MAG: hypothetical protein KDC54_22810 [Lewinella sp.]|nr:hypothetical protein [Lewinella sp.]